MIKIKISEKEYFDIHDIYNFNEWSTKLSVYKTLSYQINEENIE